MEGVLAQMRAVVEEFDERLLIGEIYLPLERLVAYYGRGLSGVHLPFNFSLLTSSWQAGALARLIAQYEAALPSGGWPNWVLGNHDWPRIVGRVGPEQARTAAMLLLTLRGTPTIYYGDELGMPQVKIPADRIRDPFEALVPGLGLGRDGSRTPMQWDGTQHAGFSRTEPWLPLADGFQRDNVAKQREDPSSIYQLHRRLIALRRTRPALIEGAYMPIHAKGDLLLYGRQRDGDRLLVALNLGHRPEVVDLGDGSFPGTVLLSSQLDRDGEQVHGSVDLRPNEGIIVGG
jgi:alpha-glucosidase